MARRVFKRRSILFGQYENNRPRGTRVHQILWFRIPSSTYLTAARLLLRGFSKSLGKRKNPRVTWNTHEKIRLGQRLILRRRHQDSKKLVALHRLHKDAENLATEELELATTDCDPTSVSSVAIRLGIRSEFEE